MADAPVLLTIDDGIARLTLNRPEAGNAVTPELAAQLRARAEELAGRPEVRAVVLGASGPMFCVGGDLGWMAAQGDGVGPALHAMATDLHGATIALAELDAPVIAAVSGVAAGAGMSLICGSDLAIAASTAKLTVAYTAAGLSPDGGSTWFLPRIVGVRRAAELMLTNRRLTADEACDLGILTRVVEPDALEVEVDALARKLAAGATGAFGATKRLLATSATATLADQLAAEADSIAGLGAGANGREGIAAFLEKRPPQFR
jgi:2-(1,2-epoxy-1,2-dihydrophenyl)acetyl-CoA isomerase